MLKYFKEEGLVNYASEQPSNWEEAVRLSCQPLIDKGLITQDYATEIVNNVHENGPYIVIADQIAMPHATADSPGVLGTGISFTKFPGEVIFHDDSTDEDKPATLFFTLAAKEPEEHLENITHLMDLLMDEDKVEALLKTHSLDDYNQLVEG